MKAEFMDCCSRICNLVNDSLLPYIEELKGCQITKEKEKEMLLSLSMVCRKIKEWTSEDGCQLKQDDVEICHNCSVNLDQRFKVDNCLANIVATTVPLLGSDNQFIQHAAGNILSSVSNFLTKSVDKWVEYIQMLLISLKATISSILTSTSLSSTLSSFKSEDLIFDFTRFVALLQQRLQDVNWLIVASLFQILRNILKNLKLENGELENVFNNLVGPIFINIPWNFFSGIDASKVNSVGLLLGNVLQLFCSLVEQIDHKENNDLVHCKIINAMPQLLSFFSNCLGCIDNRLSQYLRHKILILMYRLSFHDQFSSSHPALWINLLRQYFEDLIFKSLLECKASSENCLEGSPFLVGIRDGNTCTSHLQRLVIFLHLKCCFKLVHEETELGCHTALLELSKWLERCGILKKLMTSKNYSESCSNFALSFLQLYIEEDDMLFAMLLLLLEAPVFALQEQGVTTRKYSEAERDVLCNIESIFQPSRLFQLFLLLLNYDHLVLVDYLISKDTGVQCLQYLLRCLRLICKSWHIFTEFSVCGSESHHREVKRRKTFVDSNCQNFSREASCENARQCLLSLKKSVADLHNKHLFPYNPKSLLKSLTRFEELAA